MRYMSANMRMKLHVNNFKLYCFTNIPLYIYINIYLISSKYET